MTVTPPSPDDRADPGTVDPAEPDGYLPEIVLAKPWTVEELTTVIRRLLEERATT